LAHSEIVTPKEKQQVEDSLTLVGNALPGVPNRDGSTGANWYRNITVNLF